MRRILYPVLVCCTLAGACDSDSPIYGPQLSINADGGSAERPFEARCRLSIQPPTPIGPGVIRQIDAGTCQATHLGHSQLVSDKIINFATGTQSTKVVFTAANGDELHGTGTGTNQPPVAGIVRFIADLTFTGGTGRFAKAAGRATIRGEANIVEQRSALTMTGFIVY